MPKLGDGDIALGVTPSWPGGTETRETFQNAPGAEADSVFRLDAENENDQNAYLIHITDVLGNDPRIGRATVQALLQEVLDRLDVLEA